MPGTMLHGIFHRWRRNLTGRILSLRIKQFCKAGVFLKESEVFVVARVVAVFRTQLNGNLQIFHRRIRFAREAIEGRHRVNNVIGFRSRLASAIKVLSRFVPPAQIHEGYALGVVFLWRFCGRCRGAGNPLVADAHVNHSAISQLLARPFDYALKGLLRALEFLLLKEPQSLFVRLQLGLFRGGFGIRSYLCLAYSR